MKQIQIKNIPKYPVFLLDVWGVLYDGQKATKISNKLLEHLKLMQSTVVLISNTSRNADELINLLQNKDIDLTKIDYVITSGGLIEERLKTKKNKKYFLVGLEDESLWIKSLPGKRVKNHIHADYIISANYITEKKSVLTNYIQHMIIKKIPLYSTNPDKTIDIGNKSYQAAGIFSEMAKNSNVKVIEFGKPNRAIFERIEESLELSLKNACMIGNTLATDIVGAKQFGMTTILVNNNKKEFPNMKEIFKHHVLPNFYIDDIKE